MGDVGINIEAYRRFERNAQRTYRRTTLATISQALGWPADTLYAIAQGRPTPASTSEITQLREQLSQLAAAVARLEAIVLPLAESSQSEPTPGP